jgi:hypothetical protein
MLENPHKHIWLQDLGGEITWCDHDATDDGVKYIRYDLYTALEHAFVEASVDRALYELAIKERNYERVRCNQFETEIKRLRDYLKDILLTGPDNGGELTDLARCALNKDGNAA